MSESSASVLTEPTCARADAKGSRLMWVVSKLEPIASRHFLKFCSVGLSGVGVNVVALWFFADLLHINTNAAAALAIELSIVSNFVLNELWTFRHERSEGAPRWIRGLRFHVVSIAGAAVQWLVFVVLNVLWMRLISNSTAFERYVGAADSLVDYLHLAIVQPPAVGAWKYASQLIGIGVAVVWNFLANFHWTWKAET